MTGSLLYEQFAAARKEAIALTDLHRDASARDPSRAQLWEQVVRQTDTARLVLERWLRSGQLTDQSHPGPFEFHRH